MKRLLIFEQFVESLNEAHAKWKRPRKFALRDVLSKDDFYEKYLRSQGFSGIKKGQGYIHFIADSPEDLNLLGYVIRKENDRNAYIIDLSNNRVVFDLKQGIDRIEECESLSKEIPKEGTIRILEDQHVGSSKGGYLVKEGVELEYRKNENGFHDVLIEDKWQVMNFPLDLRDGKIEILNPASE